MPPSEDRMDSLISELRRGTVVLGVLSLLRDRQYGYSLTQRLADLGLEVDQSTLYPLLRRLEKQNLLDSDWALEEARPRRYYVLSAQGRRMLEQLIQEWDAIVRAMDRALHREGKD